MDNSYYTGATLIRAGTNNNNGNSNAGSKYSQSSSPPSSSPPACHLPSANLAGPPLLMQPNLLTGLPLIRNGKATGAGPGSQAQCGTGHSNHQHQQPPPGLICCFQPVYYIPASNQSAIYTAPPLLVNSGNNGGTHKLNHNGYHNGNANSKQHQAPKRKNYKSITPPTQMKSKPNNKNQHQPLQLSPEPMGQYYHHPKLSASASFPDPISPPAKQAAYIHHQITRTTSGSHFFATSVEATKSKILLNEEKQRNDKLLNFYFYDKHWRPRDETDDSENSESGQKDHDRSWDFVHQKSSLVSLDQDQDQDYPQQSSSSSNTSTPTFDKQPGAGRNQFSPSPQSILKQQKDLEVEAQIITLANGHRDLEIRLCYVTS